MYMHIYVYAHIKPLLFPHPSCTHPQSSPPLLLQDMAADVHLYQAKELPLVNPTGMANAYMFTDVYMNTCVYI